ncbi:MAG TPA: pitrilysin family protein, partial [Bryobacteraceae bacterium]|nr:pitrilysin family protein [Bryobacteraceae bacterium]
MFRNVKISLVSAALLLTLAAYSQTLPPGVQKITSVEGISEYSLPDGLHVLLFPDPSKPKLTVNMTYLVGSRHEGYGETGMAHLLEHMLFKLTKGGRDVKKDLTDHGAQWNGTTSWDRTNYFEIINASDDNLKWALGLEADRMVNIRMEKAILDTEMTVVRNEFEMGENNPFRMVFQRTLEAAYTYHNYGKMPIGNRSDIEHVPIEKLAA